ncbi:hypothetical protein [Lacticaseibacillus nasuensis]|nr:hypothetical protein [Lacticaseibacillus nasuensis]
MIIRPPAIFSVRMRVIFRRQSRNRLAPLAWRDYFAVRPGLANPQFLHKNQSAQLVHSLFIHAILPAHKVGIN